MSKSIPGKSVFPRFPRLSSRGSTHTTVARGTALWESLLGKPRGKATDPLIHAKGSVALLLQLGRKSHVHAPTREESRESRPHPEETRFRLLAREEGSFPSVFGKEFPVFPSHLKRRRSPQESREELQGRATFPESPRCLSPFQGNLFSLHCVDFQAEDRLTQRWHVGQPCGKASWESLLG